MFGERMVDGEFGEALAVAVDPAVADVGVNEMVLVDQNAAEGGSHPLIGGILQGEVVDPGVGVFDRLVEIDSHLRERTLREDFDRLDQVRNGLSRGDLSGVVSAHAVRKNIKLLFGKLRPHIFIVSAHESEMCDSNAVDTDGLHEMALPMGPAVVLKIMGSVS